MAESSVERLSEQHYEPLSRLLDIENGHFLFPSPVAGCELLFRDQAPEAATVQSSVSIPQNVGFQLPELSSPDHPDYVFTLIAKSFGDWRLSIDMLHFDACANRAAFDLLAVGPREKIVDRVDHMSPHELLTDRCHVSLHLAVESAALAVERLRHRTRVAACPRDPRGAAIAAIADASDLSAIAYELPASCHDDRPDAMCGYVELPLDLTTGCLAPLHLTDLTEHRVLDADWQTAAFLRDVLPFSSSLHCPLASLLAHSTSSASSAPTASSAAPSAASVWAFPAPVVLENVRFFRNDGNSTHATAECDGLHYLSLKYDTS